MCAPRIMRWNPVLSASKEVTCAIAALGLCAKRAFKRLKCHEARGPDGNLASHDKTKTSFLLVITDLLQEFGPATQSLASEGTLLFIDTWSCPWFYCSRFTYLTWMHLRSTTWLCISINFRMVPQRVLGFSDVGSAWTQSLASEGTLLFIDARSCPWSQFLTSCACTCIQ